MKVTKVTEKSFNFSSLKKEESVKEDQKILETEKINLERTQYKPKNRQKSQNKSGLLLKKIEKLFKENQILKEENASLEQFKLNEVNLLAYFENVNYAKKYELYRSFFPHDTRKISNLVDKLIKEKKLHYIKNGWIKISKTKN